MPSRRNWTEKEDQIFKRLTGEYEPKNWAVIAKRMTSEFGFRKRSGKQCRQRWYNHLIPGISKQVWGRAEEEQLLQLHRQFGNKWTAISQRMPGRTDNSIKNYFYSTIRRSLRRMGKLIGSKNSTALLRKIKPSTLTKIFAEPEQLQQTRLQEFGDASSLSRLCESVREQIIQFSSYKPKRREQPGEQEKLRYERVFSLILRLNEMEEHLKEQQKNNKSQEEIFRRDFKEMMNERSQEIEEEEEQEALSQQPSLSQQKADIPNAPRQLRTRTRQIKTVNRTDYPIISVPNRTPKLEGPPQNDVQITKNSLVEPSFKEPQSAGQNEEANLFEDPSFEIELQDEIHFMQPIAEPRMQTSPSVFGTPLDQINFFNSPQSLQHHFLDYFRGFTPRIHPSNPANTDHPI